MQVLAILTLIHLWQSTLDLDVQMQLKRQGTRRGEWSGIYYYIRGICVTTTLQSIFDEQPTSAFTWVWDLLAVGVCAVPMSF